MKVATKEIVGGKVKFNWADGEVSEFDVDSLPKEIVGRLALHGLSQKVGDSYASADTVAEAKEAAKDVWESLTNGKWSSARGTGGKIVEALARIMNQPIEVVQANYDNLDAEQKAVLAKDARVRGMLAIIGGERAQEKLAKMPEQEVAFELPKKPKVK